MKAEKYFKKEYGSGHIPMVMAEEDLVSMYSLIQEYADHFARIQIEKDRERVKDAVHESGLYHNHIGLDKIYNNTSINLD